MGITGTELTPVTGLCTRYSNGKEKEDKRRDIREDIFSDGKFK